MSVFDCIRKLQKNEAITKEQAEKAEQFLKDEIRKNGNDPDLIDEVLSAQHAFARLRENAKIKKFQKLRQLQTNLERYERIKAGAEGKGTKIGKLFGIFQSNDPIIRAMESIYERDIFDGIPQNNIHFRGEAIHSIIQAPMANAARKYAPNIISTIKKFGQKLSDAPSADDVELSKALHGGSQNASASALVKGWREAVELANNLFKKAGGIVPELKGWDLPHVWDSTRVAKSSFEDFYNDIRPRLDDDLMKDTLDRIRGDYAAKPFEVELKEMLSEIRDSIVSHGLNKERDFGEFKTATKYANRYDVLRYLHFKENEWVEVNARYGSYDLFTTMNIHLKRLADDIATVEIMGPDVEAGLRHTLDVAEHFIRKNNPVEEIEGKIKKLRDRTETLHGLSVGNFGVGNDTLARGMAAWRNWLVASYLGSTSITALGGDMVTNALTAKFNGAPITKVMKQYVDFVAKSDDAMETAAEIGLLADIFSGANLASSRMTDQLFDSSTSALLADTTLRATGLALITEAGRTATGFSLHFHLGRSINEAFGELSNDTQQFLKRYGITSDEWDLIRSNGFVDYHGQKMFNARKMIDYDKANKGNAGYQAAVKLQQGIATERGFGTITTNLRTEALLSGKSQAGTAGGEARRAFATFKRFPITVMNTHLARYVGSEQFNWKKKSVYFAFLFTLLTMNGMLAEQMQNIVNGRDPDEWNSDLLYRGMLRGGAFGILADAISKVHNGRRTLDGGDIASFLLGPQFSFAVDAGRTVASPFFNEGDAVETTREIAGDSINFASRNIPFLSSAFYIKLAFRRLVSEQLELMANPAAIQNMKRSQKQQRKKGKTYYWPSGKLTPTRAPDLNK